MPVGVTMPHDLVRFSDACEMVTTAGLEDGLLCVEVFGGRIKSYPVGGHLYVRRLELDVWVHRARAAVRASAANGAGANGAGANGAGANGAAGAADPEAA